MIEELLRKAAELGASDLHIHAGARPVFRIHGELLASRFPVLTPEQCGEFARALMDEAKWAQFNARRDLDFSYQLENLRFRINAHFQRQSAALSIRLISSEVRGLAELFLPEIVSRLTATPHGLILVTGPSGSGKSTTLAAMIDQINQRDCSHIVTLEDPVEFLLNENRCTIEQREVGCDVPDFASGLRHVLRQDPDVILVGEIRDAETAAAAITAAETGHLVLSTLHTSSAPQTIERIIDMSPSNQQNHIRSMLTGCLHAVISQTLVPRCDQPGVIPAVEVMLCNQPVKTCIRENRIFEIPSIIETSRGIGMQSLEYSLQQLLRLGHIDRAAALSCCPHPEKIDRALVA
jgi:twitching motility protein PilT